MIINPKIGMYVKVENDSTIWKIVKQHSSLKQYWRVQNILTEEFAYCLAPDMIEVSQDEAMQYALEN